MNAPREQTIFDRQIETSIVIAAPPPLVWAVLMNFPAYGQWNPFIRRLSGTAVPGSRLEAEIQPVGMSPQTFRPIVVRCETNREFAWRGSLPVPGLFAGTHMFHLEPQGTGTRFDHSETFSGLLMPFVGGVLKASEAGFTAMNEALKRECEQRAA
jgi:hypothetical protein